METDSQIRPLADIFSNLETKKACSIGVIVDSTAPYQKNMHRDFMMKIKVIDQSLNQNAQLGTAGNRFCTLMFFGKTIEELPFPTVLGDIIYMRRFDFKIWNDTFQGQKKSSANYASWMILSGQPYEKEFAPKQYSKSNMSADDIKFNHLKSPIIDIRNFSQNYFKQTSIPLCKQGSSSSDFDIIGKIIQCEKLVDSYRISLSDGFDQYRMIYKYQVDKGIVKVRSIARIEHHQIYSNDFTWILHIPQWMKSFKELGNMKFQQEEGKSSVKKRSQKENKKPLQTWTSGQHSKLQITDLSKLLQFKNCESIPKGAVFKVNASIVNIKPDFLQQILKKYQIQKNLINEFKSTVGENIYQCMILLQDKSLFEMNGLFQSYLFSWDGNGDAFFPGINPREIYGHNITRQEQIFWTVKNLIIQQTSEQSLLQLILQPMSDGKQLIWRIIDTQIIKQ